MKEVLLLVAMVLSMAFLVGFMGYLVGQEAGYRQAMEHAKTYYIETGELPSQTWIDWALRTGFDGDIRQSITAD